MAEAETINPDDYHRPELDQLALDAGLTDAERYPNKPAVADAINRVRAGEDATAVNAELAGDTAPQADKASASDDDAAADTTSQSRRKKIHAVNGGHPTKFDKTGNPVYDPEQV